MASMTRTLLIAVSAALVLSLTIPGRTVMAQEGNEASRVACDPFINAGASLIIPGWGQWLNGERQKAVMHIVVGLGLSVSAYLLAPTNLSLILAAGRGVWSIYSVYDAFTTCLRMHKEAGEMISSIEHPVSLLAFSM